MAISAGAGGAVRAGLGAVFTGGFNLLIRAGAGMVSTAAVGLYKGEFRRREGEGRRERAGRVVGSIVVRGSTFGLIGGFAAPAIAEAVHNAAGWVSDVAGSLSDHYQAEGIPTPEVPVPEVPQEITTSPLGEFTGGYDPQTHFYSGTGYNSIAKALMDNYQANTGQTLDWHALHNHVYHTEMVQQVLESNNIGDGYDSVWEGAKHMSDGATLTIEPDQIQHFVDQLNASTGQHFDAKDFMRFGPDDAAPVGAEGVSVEGLSPDIVQETNVELSNYLEGPGRGYLEAIVNGTLVPGTSEFESFQHGFAEYLSAHDSHLSAELLTQAVQHPGTVGELFQGLLAEHAVAPHFETYMGANPIDPNVSVSDYVAIFEGSSPTYYGLPDGLKAVIHQQLLQQAQQHFSLAGANN